MSLHEYDPILGMANEIANLKRHLALAREALEMACAWADNFPSCDVGWRDVSHDRCIQDLEVYRAEVMRKSREWRALLAPPAQEPGQ
jgi:hypothetical protein